MILLSSEARSDVMRLRNFLEARNPRAAVRAMRAIWSALQRLEQFPESGRATDDPGIRQIVVPFGASGYVVRYTIMRDDQTILVTRIWHGREARR
jgi:plasmid stabilization system protein ParE